MQQRLSMITLGVRDLPKSRAFYEALGWQEVTKENGDNVTFFNMSNGMVLGLFPWDNLAKDAVVSAAGEGFRGVAIAYNVNEKHEVVEVLAEAEQVGATIVKPAQDVFWGGHSGYFTDLDGHLWEVAYNPFSPLDDKGNFQVRGQSN